MKNIKLIGLDLDGTLLNGKKELTAYTKKVLERAAAEGIIILPATGRPLTGVPKEILGLPGVRYVMTANGARIIDLQEDRILWESLVPDGTSRKILKIFGEYDTLREICYKGISYAEHENLKETARYVTTKPMVDYILSTRKAVDSLWEKIEEMDGLGADKVQGVFADQTEKQEAAMRISALGNLSVSGAMGNNLEINAPGINKGAGLLKLCELLGIGRGSLLACGDGDNDVQMLRDAGIGVAMANAVPEAKAAADYVTQSNEEDGAARAIEKFAL